MRQIFLTGIPNSGGKKSEERGLGSETKKREEKGTGGRGRKTFLVGIKRKDVQRQERFRFAPMWYLHFFFLWHLLVLQF